MRLSLEHLLGQALNVPAKSKPKRDIDTAYVAFHAECKKRKITYKLDAREGWITLSSGESFPVSNWREALRGLETGEFNQ